MTEDNSIRSPSRSSRDKLNDMVEGLCDYKAAIGAAEEARKRFELAKSTFYQSVSPLSQQQLDWLTDHTALARLTPAGVAYAITPFPQLAHHLDDVVGEAERILGPNVSARRP